MLLRTHLFHHNEVFLCTVGDMPGGQHSFSGLLCVCVSVRVCVCVCVYVNGLFPPCFHSSKGAGEMGQAHNVLPCEKLVSACIITGWDRMPRINFPWLCT